MLILNAVGLQIRPSRIEPLSLYVSFSRSLHGDGFYISFDYSFFLHVQTANLKGAYSSQITSSHKGNVYLWTILI